MAKVNIQPAQDRIRDEAFEKLAQTREQTVRAYLGMSQIGASCDRALWYQYRGYTPKAADGRIYAIFDLGDAVENLLISYLRLSYPVKDKDENGKQFHFSHWNNQFQGNCDGVITINGKDRILECKSANDARFKAIKEKGIREIYPVYYCQVQCYMGFSGLDRALFAIMNKNNSDIYTEKIYFNFDDFSALVQRAYTIINANTPPERLSAGPDGAVCKYCQYRLHCWYPDMAIIKTKTCKNCKHWQINDCVGKCTNTAHCANGEHWEAINEID